MANSWQGEFPWQNLLVDGFSGTSPVASFPPNNYGLFDMAGNVWEWTSDWYVQNHAEEVSAPCCGMATNPRVHSPDKSYDPAQPQFRIPRRVVKGGSHLCAPNYCLRYRPASRQPQMVDTGMSHLGFRCILRASKNTEEEVVPEAVAEQTKSSSTKSLTEPIKHFLKQFRIVRRSLVHRQVPWHAKMVVGCAVLYVVSPIQLIPNFIPIIGQLDDVFVVALAIKFLRKCVPQAVLDECESGVSAGRKLKAVCSATTCVVPLQKR